MRLEQINNCINEYLQKCIKAGLIPATSEKVTVYHNYDGELPHTYMPMPGPYEDAVYWIAKKASRGVTREKFDIYSLHIDRKFLVEVVVTRQKVKLKFS